MKRGMVFAALALISCGYTGEQKVQSGLDLLVRDHFEPLAGKRIGLITNHTAVTRDGRHAADLFAQAGNLQLVALFGPEHGVRGTLEAGALLDHEKDPRTGVPVHSLYGQHNKPTLEMLKDVDVLVFDIQDVGARFYTYISTLFYGLEAAAEKSIPFVVLDRPNPVGGEIVEGPILDLAYRSFVGIHELPIRHGLTVGELAGLFNGEGWLAGGVKADLHVIRMGNWQRGLFYTGTGLPWIKPSPNMTDPHTALLYPGTCLVEATNLSEGRGTTAPFRQIGAPWLDAPALCRRLTSAGIEGVTADTVTFTPVSLPGTATNNKHENRACRGVTFTVTDPGRFRAVELGLHLLAAVRDLHPDSLVIREAGMNRLGGDGRLTRALLAGEPVEELIAIARAEENGFIARRLPYLLY